jgi:hypothetical protein
MASTDLSILQEELYVSVSNEAAACDLSLTGLDDLLQICVECDKRLITRGRAYDELISRT